MEMFKLFLVSAKGGGVVVAAAVVVDRGVVNVQHLVKDDVLDHEFRDIFIVQGPADGYRFMRSIVMAENAVCFSDGPCEHRFGQPPAEISAIEIVENRGEIEKSAFVGSDDLSAAGTLVLGHPLAHLGGFRAGVVQEPDVFRHSPAEQLGHEDVREGSLPVDGHVAANLGDADEYLPIPKANGVVNSYIRVKSDLDGRYFAGAVQGVNRFAVYFLQLLKQFRPAVVNHSLTIIS